MSPCVRDKINKSFTSCYGPVFTSDATVAPEEYIKPEEAQEYNYLMNKMNTHQVQTPMTSNRTNINVRGNMLAKKKQMTLRNYMVSDGTSSDDSTHANTSSKMRNKFTNRVDPFMKKFKILSTM